MAHSSPLESSRRKTCNKQPSARQLGIFHSPTHSDTHSTRPSFSSRLSCTCSPSLSSLPLLPSFQLYLSLAFFFFFSARAHSHSRALRLAPINSLSPSSRLLCSHSRLTAAARNQCHDRLTDFTPLDTDLHRRNEQKERGPDNREDGGKEV